MKEIIRLNNLILEIEKNLNRILFTLNEIDYVTHWNVSESEPSLDIQPPIHKGLALVQTTEY